MKDIANTLAITGILQFKRLAGSNAVASTNLGELVYTGLAPTIDTPALPITVSSPPTGSVIYTGLAPTIVLDPPITVTFTSQQLTSVRDTPWRVTFFIYDNTMTLRRTIIHNLNRGTTPFTDYVSDTRHFTTFDPYYIDIQVQRRTETVGTPPLDNLVNDAGNVIWQKDGADQNIISFILNDSVNDFYAFTGIDTGTEFGVIIYEG